MINKIIFAICLVLMDCLGSGAFAVPTMLAKIGYSAYLAWIITAMSALCIGLIFVRLAEDSNKTILHEIIAHYFEHPNTKGILFFIYTISILIGNIAVLEIAQNGLNGFNISHPSVHIALLTILILAGTREQLNLVLGIIKVIIMLAVPIAAIIMCKRTPNHIDTSITLYGALKAASLTLFPFVGIESVMTDRNMKPSDARKGMTIGALICLLVYLLNTYAIFNFVPNILRYVIADQKMIADMSPKLLPYFNIFLIFIGITGVQSWNAAIAVSYEEQIIPTIRRVLPFINSCMSIAVGLILLSYKPIYVIPSIILLVLIFSIWKIYKPTHPDAVPLSVFLLMCYIFFAHSISQIETLSKEHKYMPYIALGLLYCWAYVLINFTYNESTDEDKSLLQFTSMGIALGLFSAVQPIIKLLLAKAYSHKLILSKISHIKKPIIEATCIKPSLLRGISTIIITLSITFLLIMFRQQYKKAREFWYEKNISSFKTPLNLTPIKTMEFGLMALTMVLYKGKSLLKESAMECIFGLATMCVCAIYIIGIIAFTKIAKRNSVIDIGLIISSSIYVIGCMIITTMELAAIFM